MVAVIGDEHIPGNVDRRAGRAEELPISAP
jgi:hypothetical protein